MSIWYLHEVCMSPALIESSTIQCFEHGDENDVCDRMIFSFYPEVQRVLFLSQVLGSRAAEKETWSESQVVGGHLQVSLMETVSAGSIASHRGECVSE